MKSTMKTLMLALVLVLFVASLAAACAPAAPAAEEPAAEAPAAEAPAAEAPAAWAQMSIEQIVDSDPEVIILPAKHGTAYTAPEVLKGHSVWREITAVKQGRICIIDGDLVDRTGPRIVQGLREIAEAIHPELFK